MNSKYIIEDKQIGIRRLLTKDVSGKYVNWLNDPDVNKYLECRHTKHTLKSTIEYVNSLDESKEILYGIFDICNGSHIGNIKIGPINKIHKQATIGLIIGEKEYWGRGIGAKVISYMSEYATKILDLETLTAGCYECNIGSYRAFMKSGWKKVGTINNYWKFDEKSEMKTGQIIMQFEKREEIIIPKKGGITLIGGGKLMKDFAIFAKEFCNVLVVVSRRHHDDEFERELKLNGCNYHISENINNDKIFENIAKDYSRICICFGPAWIFDNKIIDIYLKRIFNFNGIPLPRYTGGAHYTWQILNQSKESGAYIQQITADIDRGGVAKKVNYQLTESATLPIHYEKENISRGLQFLKEFFVELQEGRTELELDESLIDWSQKRYFPRLLTSKNGWIDWGWSGKEIIRFCEAFGAPYDGASTTVNYQKSIRIKSLSLISDEYYHPYCSGLIVNRVKNKSLYIASSDGLLLCENYLIKDYEVNVGDRLVTPIKMIESSKNRVRFGSDGVEEVVDNTETGRVK